MILRDPNHTAQLLIYIAITAAVIAGFGIYIMLAGQS
jgi:hypothetical protein